MKDFFVKTLFTLSVITTLFSFTLMPSFALAQGLVPCGNGEYSYDASVQGATPPSNSGPTDQLCKVSDLFRVVVIVTNFLIAFAGVIAVVMIVLGGLKMVTSAGNPTAYGAAKKTMINAVIGLALTFLAFILVNSLLSTKLGIGIKDGGNIFTNTIDFIKGPGPATPPTTPPTTPPKNP